MNGIMSNRASKISKNLTLQPIEEHDQEDLNPKVIKKSFGKSYKKASRMINKMVEEGDDIHETKGECNSYYEKIKEGKFYWKSNPKECWI
jgi:hypothetical protein